MDSELEQKLNLIDKKLYKISKKLYIWFGISKYGFWIVYFGLLIFDISLKLKLSLFYYISIALFDFIVVGGQLKFYEKETIKLLDERKQKELELRLVRLK